MSSHYDKAFEEIRVKNLAEKKKFVLNVIDIMRDEELEYMWKVAMNIKGYMQFESVMKNLFGGKK